MVVGLRPRWRFASCIMLALLVSVPAVQSLGEPIAVAIVSPPNGADVAGIVPLVGTSALNPDLNGDSFVVIAVVDTGINPYSPEFAATIEMPAGGLADPSTYISGYPTGIPSVALGCGATTAIATACTGDFSGIPYGVVPYADATATTGMVWIPGTKIIGAISFDSGGGYGPTPILDEHMHGTGSASVAVGNTVGTCPWCLLVVVEGLGGTALDWASAQPWIDITTNSYGMDFRCIVEPVLGLPAPPNPLAVAGCPPGVALTAACYAICSAQPSTQPFTERGGTALFAAGNGNVNMFDSPQPAHLSPTTGPDWHVVVGAIDETTESAIVGSGKPVTISSYGSGSIPSACHQDLTSDCNFGGTSAATPQTAGVMGMILRQARIMTEDSDEGPRGPFEGVGMASEGIPVWGNQYLEDGNLSRQELWALTLRSAQPLGPDPGVFPPAVGAPASPVDYAYTGYGVANIASRDAALDTLRCGSDLTVVADKDDYLENDSQVRIARYGAWAEQKFDFTIGTAGVPLCPPVPPEEVTVTVNGIPLASSVLPDPAGAWAVNIDFALYTPIANRYFVVATYGDVSDSKVYKVPAGGVGTPGSAGGGNDPQPGGENAYPQDGVVGTGDLDEDEIPDHFDNCPRAANEGQADLNGDGEGDECDLDIDGDGYTNGKDVCPKVTDFKQRDTDGDQVGDECDSDMDDDKILNHADLCPLLADAAQSDIDGDFVGDACDIDRDNDGVPNNYDAFPDDAMNWTDRDHDNLGDQTDDGAGGPDTKSAGTIKSGKLGKSNVETPGPTAFAGILALAAAVMVARRNTQRQI